MPLRDRLTQIGTVTLPVYALSLRGAPNLAGFSFFRYADCMAEVSDAGVEVGSDGGIIGSIGGDRQGGYLNRPGP
jgi:hypothetical protein